MTALGPREELRRPGATILQILAMTALYYGAGRLGLLEQLVRGQVTPLWPPTGIALAGLLIVGPQVWPGITLGAFLINFPIGPSLPTVALIAVGNTLAPVCSYALLRRVHFRSELDRLGDALALVFLGAFTGMLVSATVGSGALLLAGALSPGGFLSTWLVWWAGDAMGVLVVAPVLLVWSSARLPSGVPPTRWLEGVSLALIIFPVSALATSAPALLFLVFPVLVWAAFRFQQAGAAPCALVASTFAIVAAHRQVGPFASHDLVTNMITLQAFNGSVALTALLLAAATSARNRTHKEIVRVCEQLSDVVASIRPPGAGEQHTRPPEDESDEDQERREHREHQEGGEDREHGGDGGDGEDREDREHGGDGGR